MSASQYAVPATPPLAPVWSLFLKTNPPKNLATVPSELGGKKPLTVSLESGAINLAELAGFDFQGWDRAILFNQFDCPEAGMARLGLSADWWFSLYLNGENIYNVPPGGNGSMAFTPNDHVVDFPVTAGRNILAAVVKPGSDGWRFVCGQPSTEMVAERCAFLRAHPDALARLEEMREWLAYGFVEAIESPWPRPYGMALRRFYENMEIQLLEGRLLAPAAPQPSGGLCSYQHSAGLCVAPPTHWKRAAFPQHAGFLDDFHAEMKARAPKIGGYTHSNPDVERVVKEGFDAMESELDAELAAVQARGGPADELNFLLSLKDYAVGVRAFHSRTADLLDKAAKDAPPERQLIAKSFRRCFLQSSDSFVEGLLAARFVWLLDFCDGIGRLDQTLGPLFERDLANGSLDLAFARRLLDELYADFEKFNGWSLQVGGQRPDGSEGYNQLSRELILAAGRNHFTKPNLVFRISSALPDKALVEALEVLREGSGRPALYNDDLYVKRFLELAPDFGLTPEDARDYGFGGCTETMFPGKSNIGSTEGSINLAKALELALHDGFDPMDGHQLGPHSGKFQDFHSFDAFMAAVKQQIQHLQTWKAAELHRSHTRLFTEGDPKLYRSFFTRDCVKRHKSFEAGGARYNGSCVIYLGVANLIDSLAAVKRCVFDDKSVGRTELLTALRADFAGSEPLRQRLLAAPKYGNDIPYVDDLGAEIMKFAFENLYAQPLARGGRFLPHSAVFTLYTWFGTQVGAMPDGRHRGAPLGDSTGPIAGRDHNGPTAMLKSVTKLPLSLAIGTMAVNIRFQKKTLQSPEGLAACAKLVRSYFALGGMQTQLSVLSKEEMEAAQLEPEKNSDLIVRIGGFSAYFTKLDQALQDTVIARTEHSV